MVKWIKCVTEKVKGSSSRLVDHFGGILQLAVTRLVTKLGLVNLKWFYATSDVKVKAIPAPLHPYSEP